MLPGMSEPKLTYVFNNSLDQTASQWLFEAKEIVNTNMIRTILADERTGNVRGSRLWAAAELSSTTWFVTETCAGRCQLS